MSSQTYNEQDFIRSLKENDPGAFKVLYEKYAPGLYSFSSRFNFSREETEEIIQETFIRIWKNRDTIDPYKPFNTFLIAIAKNLIYNQIRHSRYMSNYVKELKEKEDESTIITNTENELRQIINNALQLLPERCREVFKRSKLEGFSNQDIANDLNISKSTVENQLNKGLKIVKSYLQKNGIGTMIFFMAIYSGRI